MSALKPPPRFVTNEWAWSYTLEKLGTQGKLDGNGNPANYGAAVAMYKRVVAKYAGATAHEFEPVTRADLIGLDAAKWIVARGSAWAATDDYYVRMYASAGRWWLERSMFGAGKATVAPLDEGTVTWMLRDVPGADEWATQALRDAVTA